MNTDDQAIDRLAVTLDALDDHLRISDATVRRSERNRLSMLHLHALAAVIIGPLFAAVGKTGMTGATWAVVRLLPGAPFTLAAVLFTGGLILGVATWFRALRWEMFGLWMLLMWYATVSLSFGAAVLLWAGHGMPAGAARPSPYAPALYAHFAAVMGVHLRTLRRMIRHRSQRS